MTQMNQMPLNNDDAAMVLHIKRRDECEEKNKMELNKIEQEREYSKCVLGATGVRERYGELKRANEHRIDVQKNVRLKLQLK